MISIRKISVAVLVLSVLATLGSLYMNVICFVFGGSYRCFEQIFTADFWQYFLLIILFRESVEGFIYSSKYIFETGFVLIFGAVIFSALSLLKSSNKKITSVLIVIALFLFGTWGFYYGSFVRDIYQDPTGKAVALRLSSSQYSHLKSRSLQGLFENCELSMLVTYSYNNLFSPYLSEGERIELYPDVEALEDRYGYIYPGSIYLEKEDVDRLMKKADRNNCSIPIIPSKNAEQYLANCELKKVTDEAVWNTRHRFYYTDGTYEDVEVTPEVRAQLSRCGIAVPK